MARMTEERGAGAATGARAVQGAASDPLASLPPALRPIQVVLALGTIHATASAALAVTIAVALLDETGPAVLAWLLHGFLFGLPGAALLAIAGWRVERAITGRRPPAPHLWGAVGLGTALVAHWLPFCLLSPVLGIAGLLASGSRSDRYLEGALVAVLAWFG